MSRNISSKDTVKAAVIQTGGGPFDSNKTIDILGEKIAIAAGQGCQLAVFPEALIGGYPKGADFGARVGSRSLEGRDMFARYFDNAIELPGAELERLQEIAAKHNIMLVGGVIERGGQTLYCTMIYIGRDGSFLGKHRKAMPTALERLIWGQGDGSTLRAVETDMGVVGGAICWENYMPQLRLHQYSQGVELYCTPTVDDRDVWQHSMRHIALEGRCFVLSACQYVQRGDFPDDYECIQGNDADTVLIRGGSVIVSPLGEVLAGPVYNEEAILIAELDMSDIARGKFDLDVVGHYARPDIFTLNVNEDVQNPVEENIKA